MSKEIAIIFSGVFAGLVPGSPEVLTGSTVCIAVWLALIALTRKH